MSRSGSGAPSFAAMEEAIRVRPFRTPAGELLLGSFRDALCLCDWRHRRMRAAVDARIQRGLGAGYAEGSSPAIERAMAQLEEYLAGRRTAFDLPLRLVGSAFQQAVWEALRAIPYGRTVTYAGLAGQLGAPAAVRAVAAANGANALSIVVPCHRVVGSNGALVGYAGGLRAKRFLLGLEGALPQQRLFDAPA